MVDTLLNYHYVDVANESNIAEVEKLTARNKELKEQIEEAQSTGVNTYVYMTSYCF
jgi:cell division protein FtsB